MCARKLTVAAAHTDPFRRLAVRGRSRVRLKPFSGRTRQWSENTDRVAAARTSEVWKRSAGNPTLGSAVRRQIIPATACVINDRPARTGAEA